MPRHGKPHIPTLLNVLSDVTPSPGDPLPHHPTHAPKAWHRLTVSLAHRLPKGLYRGAYARRRMLRAVR